MQSDKIYVRTVSLEKVVLKIDSKLNFEKVMMKEKLANILS